MVPTASPTWRRGASRSGPYDATRSVPIEEDLLAKVTYWRQNLLNEDRSVLHEVVEDPSGTSHDARERLLVDMDGEVRFVLQQAIEPADQRASARHDDAAIDDVGRELGRRDLERTPGRFDDGLDRLLDALAHFLRVDRHGLRDTRDEIAALHLHLALLAEVECGADLHLDRLGRRLADEKVVV